MQKNYKRHTQYINDENYLNILIQQNNIKKIFIHIK